MSFRCAPVFQLDPIVTIARTCFPPKSAHPESMFICPYEDTHTIRAAKFGDHLTKCRRNHGDVLMIICPYNDRHYMREIHYDDHLDRCSDRPNPAVLLLEAELQKKKRPMNLIFPHPNITAQFDPSAPPPGFEPLKITGPLGRGPGRGRGRGLQPMKPQQPVTPGSSNAAPTRVRRVTFIDDESRSGIDEKMERLALSAPALMSSDRSPTSAISPASRASTRKKITFSFESDDCDEDDCDED